jgi:hypothetical protein
MCVFTTRRIKPSWVEERSSRRDKIYTFLPASTAGMALPLKRSVTTLQATLRPQLVTFVDKPRCHVQFSGPRLETTVSHFSRWSIPKRQTLTSICFFICSSENATTPIQSLTDLAHKGKHRADHPYRIVERRQQRECTLLACNGRLPIVGFHHSRVCGGK